MTEAITDPVYDWITSHGSQPERKTIMLRGIDTKKSLQNQARFQSLNETTVMQYAAAMERGDKFPPIVVYKQNGSYVVIDGNHRIAGAELALKHDVDAYVLNGVSDRQIQTMTFEANARHGLPSSQEERLAHGLFLIDMGVSQKDAAAMVSVPINTFAKEVAVSRAEARVASLGLDRALELPVTSKVRLAAIRSDEVLREASRLVIEARMGSGQPVSELVSAINAKNSDAAQLKVVEEWRQQLAPDIAATAGGRVRMPLNLLRLSRAIAYSDSIEVAEIPAIVKSMPSEQRSAMASRITRAVLLLMEAKRQLDNA